MIPSFSEVHQPFSSKTPSQHDAAPPCFTLGWCSSDLKASPFSSILSTDHYGQTV
uniref:Uncharacterized protein n=1 Tax=Anguilla anguilla TaxID=7936 RepID=A0A0E9R0G8_ANGAN